MFNPGLIRFHFFCRKKVEAKHMAKVSSESEEEPLYILGTVVL